MYLEDDDEEVEEEEEYIEPEIYGCIIQDDNDWYN